MSQWDEIDVEGFTDALLPENYELDELPDDLGTDYGEIDLEMESINNDD